MTLHATAPRRASSRSRVAPPEPKPLLVVPDWIEAHCIVPDGFRKGQPFRPYDFQFRYLIGFYTVKGDVPWLPDNPILAPAFVHRRGLLVGPQKMGKNPLIAAQVCAEAEGPVLFAGWAGRDDGYACADHGCHCGWEHPYDPGEPMGMSWPTPLIQITAFSKESTENTYDALRPMIDDGPLHDLIPKTGEEFIRLHGGGRIDTVTSSAQSRLGQRVTFVPQDEVGIYTRQNKMDKVADTQFRGLSGMGGRASMTTNMWDPAEGSVAQSQFESTAGDIYRQCVVPPRNLSYSDKRDRRKIHRIVYEPDVLRENGGHLDLDAIESEASDLVERDLAQAMRFYGNIAVAGSGHAVDPDRWDDLAAPQVIDERTEIGLGFDGSDTNDATFLRACTREGYSFVIGAWARPKGSDLLLWEAANPGKRWSVNRTDVDAAVNQAFADYRVGRMYADPWGWRSEIEGWAVRHGAEAVLAFDVNSSSRFAPAVDRWRTAIIEGTHTHDADPLTAEHVKAAHLKKVGENAEDGRTRYVIVKGSDRRKIDGAVADILALEAALTMPAAVPGAVAAEFY